MIDLDDENYGDAWGNGLVDGLSSDFGYPLFAVPSYNDEEPLNDD